MRVYGRPHVVAPLPGRQPRSSSSVTLQDLRVTILSVPQQLSRKLDVEPDDFERHTALGDCRWGLAVYEAWLAQRLA